MVATGNGTVALRATAGNYTADANISVGGLTSSDYTISGNNGSPYYCANQTISFGVNGPGSNFNWTWPSGWTYITGQGGTYVVLRSPPSSNPPTGSIAVTFAEPCGTTINKSFFVAYSSSACSPSSPYSIAPNPASSYITISCISLQTYCNIAQVQITNIYGTVLSSQSFSGTNQQVQMPVYFLQNGNYIARTYDGTQWFSNQFMVQH